MYIIFSSLTDAEAFCTLADCTLGYPRTGDNTQTGGIQVNSNANSTLHYCSIIETAQGYAVQVGPELLHLIPEGIILAASLPDPFTGGN